MKVSRDIKLTFAKRGDLAFASHRNVASLFARAVRRAGIPVEYSKGFNPRPRISFPSALETGVASECEIAFVRLAERCDTGWLAERLNGNLPEGIAVTNAGMLESRSMERTRSGRTAMVKLSRYVRRLEVDGGSLKMEIVTDDRGSLRPREVMEALALPPCDVAVRRTHVELQ
jgi:uncharacterized protein (DUF2344 family)